MKTIDLSDVRTATVRRIVALEGEHIEVRAAKPRVEKKAEEKKDGKPPVEPPKKDDKPQKP